METRGRIVAVDSSKDVSPGCYKHKSEK